MISMMPGTIKTERCPSKSTTVCVSGVEKGEAIVRHKGWHYRKDTCSGQDRDNHIPEWVCLAVSCPAAQPDTFQTYMAGEHTM